MSTSQYAVSQKLNNMIQGPEVAHQFACLMITTSRKIDKSAGS